jgi:hypothetical protein
VSASCVTASDPDSLSNSEQGLILGYKAEDELILMSSMSESRWWCLLYKEWKSYDSTTWFRIWQFQTPAWKRYLQMHLLAERLAFKGWWSGFSERVIQNLFLDTNVASDHANIFSVFSSIVYDACTCSSSRAVNKDYISLLASRIALHRIYVPGPCAAAREDHQVQRIAVPAEMTAVVGTHRKPY